LITPEFSQFRDAVASYQSTPGRLPQELAISSGQKGLSTWYAPFEHINTSARLVICGITPGWQQADKALCAARDALRAGQSDADAVRSAKNIGSFAGVMRTNLTRMLNHIGMQGHLGLDCCGDVFGHRNDLVHYTSALRYPVFKDGKDYSGSGAMVSDPYLWDQSSQMLGEEIAALGGTLWLPLGSAAIKVFEKLVRQSTIREESVLFGMPHASGANAERIKYFLGEKSRDDLSIKVNPEIIEKGRAALLAKLGSTGMPAGAEAVPAL